VLVGYAYASLQPLYVLFEEGPPATIVRLMDVALVLKILWTAWIMLLWVSPRRPGRASAMMLHAYEMQRSAAENASSFESTFLRRHFTPDYARRLKAREVGYLGVEYAHLNDFKRMRLGLDENTAGLWVRSVHGNSGAMREGIRRGDVITAFNGVPLGPGEGVGTALSGKKPGAKVDVEYVRRIFSGRVETDLWTRRRCTVELAEFSDLITAREIPAAAARLGWYFSHNSLKSGVVCRLAPNDPTEKRVTTIVSNELGQRFEVADRRMLRLALEQLIPGECVTLLGEQTSEEHSLRMAWEDDATLGGNDWHDDGRPVVFEGLFGALAKLEHRERLERLVNLYPDRFAKSVRIATLESLNDAYGPHRVICFDEQDRRLVEFCLELGAGTTVLDRLNELRIWEELESQDITVFVGRSTDAEADGFGHRHFVCGVFAIASLTIFDNRGIRGAAESRMGAMAYSRLFWHALEEAVPRALLRVGRGVEEVGQKVRAVALSAAEFIAGWWR
jgi:hypothetical protein